MTRRDEDAAGMPGREPMRPALPKRFYQRAAADPAAVEGGYSVLLDGRAVRTPGKRPLALPTLALAAAVAAEWDAQSGVVDPATMPLTRIANTTLDGVVGAEGPLAADVAAYAMSDLLCYRATAPADLVRRQAGLWDPVVRWAEDRFGLGLAIADGLMPVAQPEGLRAAVLDEVADLGPFGLAALHVMTTLTGSALLPIAVARERLTPEAAWQVAHVDEDYQIEQWGADAEAVARRAARWVEMAAAGRMLILLR